MLKASPLCKVFLDDESGLELSEYSVAAALVILGIIVAILRRKPGATADDIALMKG